MSGVKEIIYPFFLKCTEYASDNYWNNIFENLSYGICPYNTYIHNNYFCCNHKVHKFKYYLLDRESKDLYTDIHKLLSDMGLISNKDKYMDHPNIKAIAVLKMKGLFIDEIRKNQKMTSITDDEGNDLQVIDEKQNVGGTLQDE